MIGDKVPDVKTQVKFEGVPNTTGKPAGYPNFDPRLKSLNDILEDGGEATDYLYTKFPEVPDGPFPPKGNKDKV